MNWHNLTIEQSIKELNSSINGISSSEAEVRLQKYGLNELREKEKRSVFAMFIDQFKDFMIVILLIAAVISGIMGEVSDTIAIIVIVALNAVIGVVQEYRAEKAMEALKKMASPNASVIRDGKPTVIPSSHLVPGDVVLLEAGNITPADVRIIESAQLRIQEAALTGESEPVQKHTEVLAEEKPPLGDRKNMAYKGTSIAYGRGKGVVVSTGMQTELGRIASMIQDEDEVKTPLQKRLAKFGQKLAYAVLVICLIVFVFGLIRGEDPIVMLLTAISLAVAAIPEALPAVITISLALGARKMVKQNALIRKLPAVETLGSVTYICSDKTGTLTLNKMTAQEVYLEGKILPCTKGSYPQVEEFFKAIALNNDADFTADGSTIGDPTEIALLVLAKDSGFDKSTLKQTLPRVAEIPFDSDRKRMTTIHQLPDGGFVSYTKGAVESMLDSVVDVYGLQGNKPVNKDEIMTAVDKMASDGLRVLAIAKRHFKELPSELTVANVETDFTLLGLVGLLDPPRQEAKEAIMMCKTAGIKPVMITGDHPATAMTIAKMLNIYDGNPKHVMTGKELEETPLEEFEERVQHISVYARVAPEQKLKIVKALQDKGEFVAMTGDGVNDAPALKRADIGVAMGITGTDVSKEASHMILLDDNFATIVKAVKEGRRIFDNIRKFIKYTMTSNSGEIWTISLAPFFGLPIPLLPIHILWINLVTDGLPGLALAAEPAEKNIMQRPPRHPQESIFAHGMAAHIIWVGLLMGFASLFTQAIAMHICEDMHWQTMVFTVLCLSQMGHVLAIRSETESVFSQGLFSNKPLVAAVTLTFILQMATIYVPFLNPIFKTEPLTLFELALSLAISSVVFIAVEIEKFVKRKKVDALLRV